MTVRLDFGDRPIVHKQHDTHGSIALTVESGLVSGIQAATTTFALWDIEAEAKLFSGRSADILSPVLNPDTGDWGCVLSYDLQAGDLDKIGRFVGEWEITYSDSTKHTVPADNSLRIEVIGDFDGS